ncbi:MAG TPA: hypothetical protein PLU22_14160, partial [Polyangiaceae bacterium]|nr:hypothetical protein [Polyangiaceae bacterium]
PRPAGLPATVVAGDGAPALGPLAVWIGDLLVAAHDPTRALPHLNSDLTVDLPSAAVAAAFLRGFLVVRPRGAEPERSSPAKPKRKEDSRLVFTIEHLEQGREVNLWPALHRLMARHGTELMDLLGTDQSTFDWLVSHVQREIDRKLRSFEPALASRGYLEGLVAPIFFGSLYEGKLPASSPRRDAASYLPGVSAKAQARSVQASEISGAALERLWREEGKLLPEHQALLRLLSGQSLHAYVLATLRGELALAPLDPSSGGFDPEPEEPAPTDDDAGSSFWRLAQERWEDRQRPAAAPRRELRAEGRVGGPRHRRHRRYAVRRRRLRRAAALCGGVRGGVRLLCLRRGRGDRDHGSEAPVRWRLLGARGRRVRLAGRALRRRRDVSCPGRLQHVRLPGGRRRRLHGDGVPERDPAAETNWREYVSADPVECTLIDYLCVESTTMFSNDCGCRCEQSADCPEWIDCLPGSADAVCADLEALAARCPFTGVAW